MIGNVRRGAVIDFNLIPDSHNWGKINKEYYYPDNDYQNFFNISYQDLIANINKPDGIGIISSVYSIPLSPFIFYASCILNAINNKEIPLTNYFSEFYFDNMIWAIDYKFDDSPSSEFFNLVCFIEDIIFKLKNEKIDTTYSEEEKAEVINEARELINKIIRLADKEISL